MNWLIDCDVLIEGERGNPRFQTWLESSPDDSFSVSESVVGEFLLGVHAVRKLDRRRRGEEFFNEIVANLPALAHQTGDFAAAAELAGEATRESRGEPGLLDGLLAVLALREGFTVATQNVKHFQAMGCPGVNPLE